MGFGPYIPDVVGMPDYAAGDILLQSADTMRTITELTYTLKKSISLLRKGTLRVKFDLKGWGTGITNAQVYRNGAPVGTEQSRTPNTYQTFSEDIAGWSADDTCEVWCKVDANNGEIMNFRIYASKDLEEIVVTD